MARVTEDLLIKGSDRSGTAVKSAIKGQTKLKKSGKSLGSSMMANAAQFQTAMLRIASVAGAIILARKLVAFMGESVELAGVQEAAEKSLTVALGHRSQALLDQASALQQVTTFGDESIIAAQAMIAAFIDDEEQIKAATAATLDLAAAKGMTLKSAADLVSKTLGSSTNAMSRYGIEVEGAVGSTERLSSLTSSISDKFGGQATAQAELFGGKLKQLSNNWGDVKEQIGFTVTQSDDFIATLGRLSVTVKDMAPELVGLAANFVSFAESWALGMGVILDTITTTQEERVAMTEEEIQRLEGLLEGFTASVIKNKRILAGEGGFFESLGFSEVHERDLREAEDSIARVTARLQALRAQLEEQQRDGGEGKKPVATVVVDPAEQERIKNAEKAADIVEQLRQRDIQNALTADQKKLTNLDTFNAQRIAKLREATASEEQIAQAMVFNEAARAQVIEDIDRKSHEARINAASQFGNNLAALGGSLGEAGIAIQKAMALREIAINTPAAAISAYKAMAGIPIVGPALGIAAAAAAIAFGAAQARAVLSEKKPGGGAVAIPGAAAGGAAGANQAAGAGAAGPQQQTDLTVRLVMDVRSPSRDSLVQEVKVDLSEDFKDNRINFITEQQEDAA